MFKFKKVLKIIVSLICILIIVPVLSFTVFLATSSILEYKPKDIEDIKNNDYKKDSSILYLNNNLSILTYNIGYCGLDETEDFFMDYGKNVQPKSKKQVENNLKNIAEQIKTINADFTTLQEIDYKSKRSYYINELEYLKDNLHYNSYNYARNFKSNYVPYPFKQCIGKVDSGIATYSRYLASKSQRIKLPSTFKWPVSMFNLKRCLLINEYEIKDSDKKLYIINLHLEAFDNNDAKILQTQTLIKYLNSLYQEGNYVMAIGDYNQSFSDKYNIPDNINTVWKTPMLTIPNASTLKDWQKVYDDSTPSCRSNNQPYVNHDKNTYHYIIDGCIASPNIKINKCKTLDYKFKYSDHNPVFIDFNLKV